MTEQGRIFRDLHADIDNMLNSWFSKSRILETIAEACTFEIIIRFKIHRMMYMKIANMFVCLGLVVEACEH